jgi:biotin carboxyl carrier protein
VATTYHVTIGERTLKVCVRRDDSRVLVAIDDGQEREVQLSTVHGALRSLVLGEQHVELLAARRAEGVELAIGGHRFRAEVLDEARARLAQVAGARGGGHGRRELKAPMPGLVVRVLADVGASVEAGQPLVVLQAMKMENELALPRGGTVTAVNASAGQTVEAGQVLAVVE